MLVECLKVEELEEQYDGLVQLLYGFVLWDLDGAGRYLSSYVNFSFQLHAIKV